MFGDRWGSRGRWMSDGGCRAMWGWRPAAQEDSRAAAQMGRREGAGPQVRGRGGETPQVLRREVGPPRADLTRPQPRPEGGRGRQGTHGQGPGASGLTCRVDPDPSSSAGGRRLQYLMPSDAVTDNEGNEECLCERAQVRVCRCAQVCAREGGGGRLIPEVPHGLARGLRGLSMGMGQEAGQRPLGGLAQGACALTPSR